MLANYPFLPETKEYVKQNGITMDFLASDPKIAEKGFGRVEGRRKRHAVRRV